MAPDGIVITPEMLDGVSSFQMSGQRDKRARHRPGTSALPAAGPGVGTLAVGPSDSGINGLAAIAAHFRRFGTNLCVCLYPASRSEASCVVRKHSKPSRPRQHN
jgi:hypothetical protein